MKPSIKATNQTKREIFMLQMKMAFLEYDFDSLYIWHVRAWLRVYYAHCKCGFDFNELYTNRWPLLSFCFVINIYRNYRFPCKTKQSRVEKINRSMRNDSKNINCNDQILSVLKLYGRPS